MSKITDIKDTLSEMTRLLEKYRFQCNYLQMLLFRVYKQNSEIEISREEFTKEEINAVNFDFTEDDEVLTLSARVFQTIPPTTERLEKAYRDLIE